MDLSIITVKESLHAASAQYNALVHGASFNYENWKENVKLLSPIITALSERAKTRIDICEHEIAKSSDQVSAATKKRAALYEKANTGNKQLSELDEKRLSILAEIQHISDEIAKLYKQIEDYQKRIRKEKEEYDKWKTAFYATCWIPFVNIGTGVKQKYEGAQYEAAAEKLGREIDKLKQRIAQLNNEHSDVCKKQKENHESSGKLANEITAIEGEVAAVTDLINELRQEMGLWQTILMECNEINTILEHANGKMEQVAEAFASLVEVEELLAIPTTDKYISGRKCIGQRLAVGGVLRQNEYLMSANRRFVAIMQDDNNFVVYNSEKPLWASGTWGARGIGYMELGADGLVTFKGTNRQWNTKRGGAAEFVMQNDGNLVAYDTNHNALWATDTFIYANAPGIYFMQTAA